MAATMKTPLLPTLVATLLLALGPLGCATAPPNPNPRAAAPLVLAPQVDLQRFMGRWYVIANIPYFGERGYVGSYVEYVLRPDGDIDDYFFGHQKSFDAPLEKKTLKDWVIPGTNNARWKARPFWPLAFDFLILDVDADYQTTLIGYPDKQWGWIFARTPEVDDATYAKLLAKLEAQGYDSTRFRKVPQRAAQIGQPGFQ